MTRSDAVGSKVIEGETEREYRPAQPKRWRPRWMPPGWTVLILLAGLIFAWSYYDSRIKVPVETISIDTWVCSEEIVPGEAWNAYLRAGCTPGDVDAEVTVMHLAGELPTASHKGSRVVIDRIPIKSFELSFQIEAAEPRQAVLQGDYNSGGPRVTGELNSDRASQKFTAPFRPDGGTRFILLFGPEDAPAG